MAIVELKGNQTTTSGDLPPIGTQAPDFTATKTDMTDLSLKDFAGKKVILNIFPSIDTGTCAASAREFNKQLASLENTVVLCISKDLPFAHRRFCEVEGLKDVIPVSVFKNTSFPDAYPVTVTSGPLTGLLSRAVVVIDETGKIIYTEQVSEITKGPDYKKALDSLKHE